MHIPHTNRRHETLRWPKERVQYIITAQSSLSLPPHNSIPNLHIPPRPPALLAHPHPHLRPYPPLATSSNSSSSSRSHKTTVDAKPDLPLPPPRLRERAEWFTRPRPGPLVHADHLAALAGTQDGQVDRESMRSGGGVGGGGGEGGGGREDAQVPPRVFDVRRWRRQWGRSGWG